MVTLAGLYREARAKLAAGGIQNSSGEALLLCGRYLGAGRREDILVKGESVPSDASVLIFRNAISQRLSGRPLQYILGAWEFDGLPLTVREGVLCPREDTLALVELCDELISEKKAPAILDLCAGTGAVGLALLQRRRDASCIFVEYSPDACQVLEKNASRFGNGRGKTLRADVLSPPEISGSFDLICSNPPYIPTEEIKKLTGDVLREPVMALDGGEDGLLFYRAILENWLPFLNIGGHIAFETGFDQREAVESLMITAGLENIRVKKDMAGIDRAVAGKKCGITTNISLLPAP